MLTGQLRDVVIMKPRAVGTALGVVCATLVLVLGGTAPVASGARGVPVRELGTNLTLPVDWDTEVPFVDVFRLTRPWISQRDGAPYGQGGPLDLDSHGWIASLSPGQHADTVMLDNGGYYPAGRYTLLYDGSGTLDFLGTARVVSSSAGRIELDVPAHAHGSSGIGGIRLRIVTTDRANYVRDIRVLMPGHASDYRRHPFNPAFLNTIRPFRQLRFVAWMATDHNPPGAWGKRSTLQTYTWQPLTGGVPVEVLVGLANTLHASPWFTLPHSATDEYIRRFAAIVRDRLAPGLIPHVEYTNEAWNGVFSQAGYVQDQGIALGLSSNRFQAGLRYYSQRAVQVLSIWARVFGHRRFYRVLSAQAANPWTLNQVLSWHDDYRHADEAAVAPYFTIRALDDPTTASQIATWPVSQVLDAADQAIRTFVRDTTTQEVGMAHADGLPLVAYEGGQSLVAGGSAQNNAQLTNLLIAANRSPRMYSLYTEYLDQWKRVGGGLFMNFADVWLPSKYGSWGALEYLGQDIAAAPKYRALMAWISAGQRTR